MIEFSLLFGLVRARAAAPLDGFPRPRLVPYSPSGTFPNSAYVNPCMAVRETRNAIGEYTAAVFGFSVHSTDRTDGGSTPRRQIEGST